MKKLLAVGILLFSLFLMPNSVLAQTATPQPTGSATSDESTNSGYTLTPPLEGIDDATPTVRVVFNDTNIPPDAYVCLESDYCIDDDAVREGIADGNQSIMESAYLGLEKDKVDENTLRRYKLVGSEITVCGDGDKKLKAIGTSDNHDHYEGANGKYWDENSSKLGCKPERDYFHAGKSYTLAVYVRGESDGEDTWALLDVAGFYVNHHFPEIKFNPPQNFNPDNVSFPVTLQATADRARGGGNIEDRNNYKIEVQAPGYREARCGSVLVKDGPVAVDYFKPRPDTLRTGKLRVYIREQVAEDPFYREVFNKSIDFTTNVAQAAYDLSRAPGGIGKTADSICRGGFTYRLYDCEITKVREDVFTTNCKKDKVANPDWNPEDPTSPQFFYPEYFDDPSKVDVKGLLAYFDALGVNAANTRFPCNIGSATIKDPSGCKVVKTAIGDIPTDPLGFIMRIFSIVLSVAGIGAIVIIIFAGYRMMLSRGNPEALKSARESLTAAVIGLVFIVFSLVLLSIVAGNILKLPGFTDETATVRPGINDPGFQP